MKEIKITVKHNLSPMHEEIMIKTIAGMMEAQNGYWKIKSKKKFSIKIEHSQIKNNK